MAGAPPATVATPEPSPPPNASAPTHLTGRVVGVQDGDTLTLLVQGSRQVRVRLAEIDAPEKRQPYGEASRRSLAQLCADVEAAVMVLDVDRYGRSVGRVTCREVDANREQLARGMAWRYVKYARDPALAGVESEAREQRRGLWVDDAPTAPWEWRRQ